MGNDESYDWPRESGLIVMKAVRDLNVHCMLRVRNYDGPGIAASDCCGAPATTAVELKNGVCSWRCDEHRGLRRLERGPVWENVPQRVDNQD